VSESKSNRFSYFLRFRASPATLERVRSSITELSNRLNLASRFTDDLVLAVYEACANVLEHAYGGREGGQIYLSITLDGDVVEVIIMDRGASFDLDSFKPLEPKQLQDEGRDGGMGYTLIKTIMDTVDYSTQGGGINMMRMTKRITSNLITPENL
jgi:anti-sigma regulatory factor (Ser/Thr protein kinase)